MHRFFVEQEQIQPPLIYIQGADAHHITHVLRMKPGEEVLVSDNDTKEYTCQVETLSGEQVALRIRFVEEVGLELPSELYLFQGLPKGDKMELIIQKAVELGAAKIIPVATKRSVVKLDAKKAANKQKRWQGISESAAKQAKRMYIPQVEQVMNFAQALEYAKDLNIKLIPYELAEGMDKTRQIIEGIAPGQSVGIFIGPEGGFAPEEVEQAMAAGFAPITLGKRILRTETAGFTLLSILMYHLEAGN